MGVLGVVPGQIGLIQATEAIKFILGRGASLRGRFLIYDALEMDFKVFSVRKNETCLLCSTKPVITGLTPQHYREPKEVQACTP